MFADQLDILSVGDAVMLPCLDHDPELFFAAEPAHIEAAKLVCQDCPMIKECLDGALRRREPHGVWGGQLLLDGVVVPRKRPRGRPRKNPLPVIPALPTPLPVRNPRRDAARTGDEGSDADSPAA
ncbi:WhiB family transcriptional regulator [Propionibacteriaceae bacterium G1746]|uniref:WhiB family transcriptional regulator n=1 Tax=Aestuariimicrobium sp. G57 TaxID=3418485 RepID=UPI003C1FF10E